MRSQNCSNLPTSSAHQCLKVSIMHQFPISHFRVQNVCPNLTKTDQNWPKVSKSVQFAFSTPLPIFKHAEISMIHCVFQCLFVCRVNPHDQGFICRRPNLNDCSHNVPRLCLSITSSPIPCLSLPVFPFALMFQAAAPSSLLRWCAIFGANKSPRNIAVLCGNRKCVLPISFYAVIVLGRLAHCSFGSLLGCVGAISC